MRPPSKGRRSTRTSRSRPAPATSHSGHCRLDFLALPGLCTLSGGTGTFTHLHLWVAVSPDATPNLWHWDGTFAFGGGS